MAAVLCLMLGDAAIWVSTWILVANFVLAQMLTIEMLVPPRSLGYRPRVFDWRELPRERRSASR